MSEPLDLDDDATLKRLLRAAALPESASPMIADADLTPVPWTEALARSADIIAAARERERQALDQEFDELRLPEESATGVSSNAPPETHGAVASTTLGLAPETLLVANRADHRPEPEELRREAPFDLFACLVANAVARKPTSRAQLLAFCLNTAKLDARRLAAMQIPYPHWLALASAVRAAARAAALADCQAGPTDWQGFGFSSTDAWRRTEAAIGQLRDAGNYDAADYWTLRQFLGLDPEAIAAVSGHDAGRLAMEYARAHEIADALAHPAATTNS